LLNSRLGRFTATVRGLGGEPLNLRRHTFSRSYGVNLPSSFAGDHSSALGFSPRLPVSVCGTVSVLDPHRGFSWQPGVVYFAGRSPRDRALALNGPTDLPVSPAYTLQPALPIAGQTILLRHPWINSSRRYRNIDLFPIGYASQPHLRDRLTLSGLTFLRKP
jgi:hypothetical protein